VRRREEKRVCVGKYETHRRMQSLSVCVCVCVCVCSECRKAKKTLESEGMMTSYSFPPPSPPALSCGNDSTGQVLWSYATRGAVRSSPAVDVNLNVYFGSYDFNIYKVCLSR
jgi:hypothetical protein